MAAAGGDAGLIVLDTIDEPVVSRGANSSAEFCCTYGHVAVSCGVGF